MRRALMRPALMRPALMRPALMRPALMRRALQATRHRAVVEYLTGERTGIQRRAGFDPSAPWPSAPRSRRSLHHRPHPIKKSLSPHLNADQKQRQAARCANSCLTMCSHPASPTSRSRRPHV